MAESLASSAPEMPLRYQVNEYIANGKYKVVTSCRLGKSKSSIWTTFLDVVDDKGETTDFVSCSVCNKLYVYNARNGTSTLLSHQRSCCALGVLPKKGKFGWQRLKSML